MRNNLRRVLALALILLLPVPAFPALAAEMEAETEAEEIIYIRTAEDFLAFAESCSYDAWSRDRTVVLERDISLSGVNYLPAASFSGVFDGGGHTISGLELTASVSPAGLFGIIRAGGTVQNLNVEGTVAPGGSGERTGGIAGVNEGLISGCAFSGTVSGETLTGGICGENTETGVVRLCAAGGGVFGKSMTGGVAGGNSGALSADVNRAYVNTNMLDPTLTLSELNLNLTEGLRRLSSPDTYNVATDSGGVAGWSDGLLSDCGNYGAVGYQHIGYNVGGIVGRSSGRVSSCTNHGAVNGRKDVGGVAGLAEPYVVLRLTESSIDTVRAELDALNRLVENMANDASGVSSAISARLTAIGGSIDDAERRAQDLTGKLADDVDGVLAEVNRGSEILSGTLPLLSDTAEDFETAAGTLTMALDQLETSVGDLNDGDAFGEAGEATEDFSSASEEMAAAVRDLRSFADTISGGISEVRAGLDTLQGTIGPAEGVSRQRWDDLILNGYTDEEGNHKDGALDNIVNGNRKMLSGMSGVTGVLGALIAGLEDETIAPGDVPDYLKDAGLSAYLAQASEGLTLIEDGAGTVADNTEIYPEAARRGMDQIKSGLDTMASGNLGDASGAFAYLSAGMKHLGNAAAAAGAASEDLQTAAGTLRDASAEFTAALGDMQELLDYLRAQDPLQFDLLEGETDALADVFYDSLHDVSNQLEKLNGEAKDSSDQLIRDARRINNQFLVLMNTLLDVVDDAGSAGVSDVVEDTSDEDIDAAVNGKLYRCANTGTVSGDIDVGGVAGSMMVYNELNPEGDDSLTFSAIIHRTYQLKCILQDCANSGEVVGKRNNVGAVCGEAQLGVISGCKGFGRVESEDGDYVGGIAGHGDNILRGCWARCSLSGRKYVGGIVGGGEAENANLRVESCRSLVEITGASQYSGAIAGADTGVFAENRFVSDTLAGIDRVSVQGQAEPITYAALLEAEDLPEEFRSFTLSFVAGDSTLKTLGFHYGDSFGGDVFPEIPEAEGQYARWDRDELRDLRFDTTVTAVYTPSVTALSGGVTRADARPVFFAQGAFTDGDILDVSPAIVAFETEQGGLLRRLRSYERTLLEQWQLDVPADGAETHTLRYLPPRTAEGTLELYVSDGGDWTRVATEAAGSYLAFDAAGADVYVSVVSVATPWWVTVIVGVFLLAAVVLLIVLLARKKSKRELTDEEKARAARFRKRRKRLLIVLLIVVLALGAAAGALLLFSPDITNLELYMLLRNYAERSELDMDLTLSAYHGEESWGMQAELFTTDCEGKRVSRAAWEDVPLYFCDGVMLLENGEAFRIDDALPDYTQLLSSAAGVYRTLDVTVSEQNGTRIYHAEAQDANAVQLLSVFLPDYGSAFTDPAVIELDLTVTDGEPTSLKATSRGTDAGMSAELTLASEARDHTVPQAVRNVLAAGEYVNAPEIGAALRQSVGAWMELFAREPLTAAIRLKADCGPLLLDETLTWQRTRRYGPDLSLLVRRGTSLYFTDEAACTGSGLAVGLQDPSRTDAKLLLELAYRAILLSDVEFRELGDRDRYSVTLGEEAMERLTDVVAPEAAATGVSFTEGSVWMDVKDGRITGLRLDCAGTLRVVRADVPASVSAELRFDRKTAFPAVPQAVLDALGLA